MKKRALSTQIQPLLIHHGRAQQHGPQFQFEAEEGLVEGGRAPRKAKAKAEAKRRRKGAGQ